MMHKRHVVMGACLSLALIFVGWLFFIWGDSQETAGEGTQVTDTTPVAESDDQVLEVFVMGETQAKHVKGTRAPEATDTAGLKEPNEPVVTIQYPEGLEGIKQQIYDINVEYIEDLEMLDAMGHITDQPPEVLWQGEWSSADDWKRRGDGFRIEQREDGSFAFFPDADTSRSYAWDEEKGEFYWELDYYGKIITHKARFIDENVLVLMTISGRKVALDIYSKAEKNGP